MAKREASSKGFEFQVPPAEYADLIRKQRERGEQIAAKLLAGEGATLSRLDQQIAGEALLRWARGLSEVQPRTRGQAPAFDHASATFEYAMARARGDKTVTIASLAAKYDVTDEAMQRAIKANLPAVKEFVAFARINSID
ncbi:hypothetical protein GCM10027431_09580 [Lysobacter rhizosphaerae]